MTDVSTVGPARGRRAAPSPGIQLAGELATSGADEDHRSFSSVVSDALASWLRGRLIDAWLAEYQAEHGEFSEDELRALAAEAGVPYVPPATVRAEPRDPDAAA
ncbi:hypothetical protein [Raineyella sp. W15-4]|uniref:hypothetical protein n=1 Tax=Raineyella sp. W15-4 TaxID=3081651 RepID=UPI0029542EE2|nr:hypothetical protein [Raineyella sp. W15-4]WOQ16948.1 hypothetical protein R0145_17365 [Raineyella sp. W15-4]